MPIASIGMTNASPDIYTERLNASIGAGPSGFSTSGSINGLVAGASSNAIGVALNTSSAGNFNGQAALGFVSSGTGTTGAPDQALARRTSTLSRHRVHTGHGAGEHPGGQLRHRARRRQRRGEQRLGDQRRGRGRAERHAGCQPERRCRAVRQQGTLSGLAAQATDTSSLMVTLNTANAGVFNGSANASFVSQNAQLSDLNLGSTAVTLQAQVNNYAELSLGKTAGAGSFSFSAGTYTLEFGNLVQGSAALDATLAVLNSAIGPADLLSGIVRHWQRRAFALSGFGPFMGMAAGASYGGLGVSFDSSALGDFTRTIVISSAGSNASGFQGALADTTLVLQGSVVAVPEPSTYALMAGGLLAVWLARQRGIGCA